MIVLVMLGHATSADSAVKIGQGFKKSTKQKI
jgi:hypothetical protein